MTIEKWSDQNVFGKPRDAGPVTVIMSQDEFAAFNRLTTLLAERDETIRRWQECGDQIMLAVTGRAAPLSDSDVIAYIADLKEKLHKLQSKLEAMEIELRAKPN